MAEKAPSESRSDSAERREAGAAKGVRELRGALDCSQEEFAKILGITVAALSRWETGKAHPQGRNAALLECLRERLSRPGCDPERLKRILLVGGALVVPGMSPVGLLAGGLLEEFVAKELASLLDAKKDDDGGRA